MNNEYYEAIGVGAVVNGAAYYGTGYILGSLIDSDPSIMGQAMLIYSLANTILHIAVDLLTEGKERSPCIHACALLVGECTIGILQIYALKQFQLIAELGVIVMACGLHMRALYRLSDLHHTFVSA